MNNRLSYFAFNGQKSTDYGLVITDCDNFTSAEKDISTFSISGYNGDYITDNMRYNNVDITYICSLIPLTQKWHNIAQQINAINLWLHGGDSSYCKLIDSYSSDTYRFAYLKGSIQFSKRGLIYTTSIKFSCEPFCYSYNTNSDFSKNISDEKETIIVSDNNAMIGIPKITIKPYLSSAIGMTFKINNTNWYISSDKEITIDSKTGKVYDTDGNYAFYHNGTVENFVAPIAMPLLTSGNNTITIDKRTNSNISNFQIECRWCHI